MKGIDVEMDGTVAKKLRYAIHPRNGWVLIRKITPEEVITEAGVIVNKDQARTLQGEVVEAGRKVDGSASDLLPGDRVIITAYSMEIEDIEELTGEKNLVMLRDEEVYASAELLNDEIT